MESTGWLEVDQERTHAPAGLTLDTSGITMTDSGRRVHARWGDVLGVARVGATIYVLAPRRPPLPPWIEIDATTAGRDAEELLSEIRERSERSGYREGRLDRALLAPDELLARVIARDDVAGAVEVPVSFAVPRARHEGVFAMLGAGGGFAGGIAMLIAAADGAWVQLASYAALGFAIGGMLVGVRISRALGPSRGRRPRVMVLAPDGLVSSLDGAVRALRWDRIESVDFGLYADGAGDVEERLRLRTKKSKTYRVDVRWLDAPIEIVVAVAEAYRVRWSPACARAREIENAEGARRAR